LQVIAAALSLLYVSPWRTTGWPTTATLSAGTVDVFVWLMLIVTAISGVTYTRSAIAVMRSIDAAAS
jgi:CDP-diacylglycerol---glycerol-3-phosphate 3-phosphatidyltransferase